MSDAKLRDLERRWKETGSVEDEAAYLVERVRTGDLAGERLELASRARHPAAVQALGREGQLPNDALQFKDFVRGLTEGDREVATRTLVAMADHVMSRVRLEGPRAPRAQGCLVAARAWLTCPCEQHEEEAAAAAGVGYVRPGERGCVDTLGHLAQDQSEEAEESPDASTHAAHAAEAAAGCAAGAKPRTKDGPMALLALGVPRSRAYEELARTISTGVGSWALGYIR